MWHSATLTHAGHLSRCTGAGTSPLSCHDAEPHGASLAMLATSKLGRWRYTAQRQKGGSASANLGARLLADLAAGIPRPLPKSAGQNMNHAAELWPQLLFLCASPYLCACVPAVPSRTWQYCACVSLCQHRVMVSCEQAAFPGQRAMRARCRRHQLIQESLELGISADNLRRALAVGPENP